jgi:hypothetical protein
MFKKILIGLVVVVGGFVAFAASRPDTYRVERSAKIGASPVVVFTQIEDFRAWAAWSPWEKLDPQMQKTFSGPPRGVGSIYEWQGNDKVGKGKMTITDTSAPMATRIELRLEFIEPFAAVATTTFTIAPVGDGAASVTWTMDGTNNLMGKIFGIFMDMDKQIGGDFEKGLDALRVASLAEQQKVIAAAAAAEDQAQVAPAAAAMTQAANAAAAVQAAGAARAGSAKPQPAAKSR